MLPTLFWAENVLPTYISNVFNNYKYFLQRFLAGLRSDKYRKFIYLTYLIQTYVFWQNEDPFTSATFVAGCDGSREGAGMVGNHNFLPNLPKIVQGQ